MTLISRTTRVRIRPPGPRGRPIIGVLTELISDPLQLFQDAARYGDIVGLPVMGKTLYFINHPDYIKHVLVENSPNYRKGPALTATRRLTGNGVLTSEGTFHKRQRQLIQPALHRQRIAAFADVMTAITERQIDGWQPGETRDIHREMMVLTMKVVAKCLYGTDVTRDAERLCTAVSNFIDDFSPVDITPLGRWLEKVPTPRQRRRERNARTLDNTIYRIIHERRASCENKGDLLSVLLKTLDTERDGGGMTDRQVRDEVMTLFLAGSETTGPALTWTFYLLSQYPDVDARLHAELETVMSGRTPTLADLPQLKYTHMVFAESLRLYPPAWGIARRPLVEDEIGGYTIPVGETVVMSQYVMHRNPVYWDSPEEFRPTRFEPEFERQRPRYTYFPFGGGPRQCIGEQFAWMEAELLLATIARRYRLKLAPGARIEPIARMSIRLRQGMPMVITPR